MEEGNESGGRKKGPGSTPATVESAGCRLRFRVDLQPGETTVVSWESLLREANLSNPNRPESSSDLSFVEKDDFVSKLPLPVVPSSSKQKADNETNDSQAQAGPNRLSAVIERIERMYAGNGSSDEEDLVLDNVPDDDEYDTEDSFIDDTELDDYFQVDNSAIKHDGFFVNRGKLECIEPIVSTDEQPKKRRPEEFTEGGGVDVGHSPHKIMKMVNKGKSAPSLIQTSSTNQYCEEVTHNVQMLVQGLQVNDAEVSLKNTADIQVTVDTSGLWKGDAIRHDKKSHNAALMQIIEGPTVGAKSTLLENATRELYKMVAELRPPSIEAQDPDNASQAVKRRLPPEIKQKLAEVASIAQDNYGTVPKDVINHLMSIVGHLMHIATLKRNLKAMANMGLSVKDENDDCIQKIKQEVAEMVKSRILHMKPKLEHLSSNSDDFQDAGPEEKEACRWKYNFKPSMMYWKIKHATYMTFLMMYTSDFYSSLELLKQPTPIPIFSGA